MNRKLMLMMFSFASVVGSVSAALDYSCYPNETIVVINPLPDHYIGVFANNSARQCDTVFSTNYENVTITGCGMDEDILLQLSNRSAADTILGGSGIYLTTVRCNNIDVVNKSIEQGFSASLEVTTQGILSPTFGIQMEFRSGGSVGAGYSDGTLTSSVRVGVSVKWIFSMPSDYYIKIGQCTAYSGSSSSGSPSIQLIVDRCTQDSSFTGSFSTANSVVSGGSRYYYTTFYPFRFYNNDHIFILCSVKVCSSSGSSNCDMAGSCTKKRRRAESVDERINARYGGHIQTAVVLKVTVPYLGKAPATTGLGLLILTLSLLAYATK